MDTHSSARAIPAEVEGKLIQERKLPSQWLGHADARQVCDFATLPPWQSL